MRFSRTTMLVGGLAIALAVPAIAIAKAGPDTSSSPSYIIGGSTVSSAPWSAQVYRGGNFTCSGTIIAPTWVLTAKHCVGSSMSVRVGNVNRGSGTQASVTQYYNAPNGSDLSLLKLASAAGSTFAQLGTANPPVGAEVNIYGWGMTCRTGCQPSTVLKTARVRVTSICRDYYGGEAICSTRIDGAAWSGDSGGPKMHNGLQVGVASTADGGTNQQYTSVIPSRAWIMQMIGGSQTTPPPTTTRPPSSPPATTQPPTTPPTTQPPGGTTWAPYTYYAAGTTVTYNGVTYRCIQSHTAYPGWEPPNVPALWARV
ncbi:MAG TPA: trypsin-like serine protease [Pilimelia sp.]|nr:trypsin-like serine protease [Pilimelia sp.]